jgi:hypothetical protein
LLITDLLLIGFEFNAAIGREPLLAALKLAAVEGLLCGQDRNLHPWMVL